MSEYKLEPNEEQTTNPFTEKIINQAKLVSKVHGISLQEAVELMYSAMKGGNRFLESEEKQMYKTIF